MSCKTSAEFPNLLPSKFSTFSSSETEGAIEIQPNYIIIQLIPISRNNLFETLISFVNCNTRSGRIQKIIHHYFRYGGAWTRTRLNWWKRYTPRKPVTLSHYQTRGTNRYRSWSPRHLRNVYSTRHYGNDMLLGVLRSIAVGQIVNRTRAVREGR